MSQMDLINRSCGCANKTIIRNISFSVQPVGYVPQSHAPPTARLPAFSAKEEIEHIAV
jgi:hypothetical protein